MPQGTSRISKPLTNLSVHYKNAEYIADMVLPQVPVKQESDLYWAYTSDFRLPETARANGALANMATWDASTNAYYLEEHSLKDVITDRDYENYDSALVVEKHTTEYLIDKLMMRKEYRTHQLLFTTTTFSNNATLTSATSWKYHTTTSAPIQNVLSATGYVVQYAGKRPNKGVMSWNVFAALKENPNVYGRIQYVEKAIVTEQILASLFDIQQLHVGTATYDSAKEGETESQGAIWGDDFLLGYFGQPRIRDANAAINLYKPTYGSPFKVKKWREEDVEGNYIEVQSFYAPKAVATSAAYLIKSASL